MSTAPALCAPMSSATRAEIDGNERSGEAVAVRIRSISAGAMSARSIAWRAAMIAAHVIGSEAREELGSIQGIGPAIAEELVEFFAEPRNLAALDDLAAEVSPLPVEETSVGDSPFAAKTMVFTGTLERMTRDEAEALA